MTKVSFFRYFLPVLALLFITPVFAQNDSDGEIINGGKILDLEEDDKIIESDENCMASFTIKVQVVNFEEIPDNPSNYPPMFVAYRINQSNHDTIAVSFDHFSQSSSSVFWEWTYDVNLDVSDYCLEGVTTIYVQVELLSLENGIYFPYPAHHYATPSDIFACTYFDATCEFCPPENGGCEFPTYRAIAYDDELSIDCTNCLAFNPPASANGGNSSDRESGSSGSAALAQVQIAPNPFKDHLQINSIGADASNLSLRIFSATGQVIFKGTGSSLIPVENWAPGVYFMELRVAGDRRLERLLKIE